MSSRPTGKDTLCGSCSDGRHTVLHRDRGESDRASGLPRVAWRHHLTREGGPRSRPDMKDPQTRPAEPSPGLQPLSLPLPGQPLQGLGQDSWAGRERPPDIQKHQSDQGSASQGAPALPHPEPGPWPRGVPAHRAMALCACALCPTPGLHGPSCPVSGGRPAVGRSLVGKPPCAQMSVSTVLLGRPRGGPGRT